MVDKDELQKRKELGRRIDKALTFAGLSQSDLARALKISPAAVSTWVSGRFRPSKDRMSEIVRLTGVNADWFITGRGDDLQRGDTRPTGRLVPKVSSSEIVHFEPRTASRVNREMVFSHFPCGPHSFQITIEDNANAPDFEAGDSVIIDPDLDAKPGDMVLMVVQGAPLFRKWRPRGKTVELVPLNDDWDTVPVTMGRGVTLRGVMSEHGRRRRG